MKQNNLSYKQAKPLIEEGDVLLFRGNGLFSRLIKRYGEGRYSHVGLASRVNGIVECVEFVEKAGGRAVNLQRYVQRSAAENFEIDVYRPIPHFLRWEYDKSVSEIKLTKTDFDGRAVTNTMRQMTGLPYGWKRVFWILLHKFPVLRMFYDINKLSSDELKELIYPVCSTSTAYSFNKNNSDIVLGRADTWTEPSDIARSPRISYLFTLKP